MDQKIQTLLEEATGKPLDLIERNAYGAFDITEEMLTQFAQNIIMKCSNLVDSDVNSSEKPSSDIIQEYFFSEPLRKKVAVENSEIP